MAGELYLQCCMHLTRGSLFVAVFLLWKVLDEPLRGAHHVVGQCQRRAKAVVVIGEREQPEGNTPHTVREAQVQTTEKRTVT